MRQTLLLLFMAVLVPFGLMAQSKPSREGILSIKVAPLQAVNGQFPVLLEIAMPKRFSLGFWWGPTTRNFAQQGIYQLFPALEPAPYIPGATMAQITFKPERGSMTGLELNYYWQRSKSRFIGFHGTLFIESINYASSVSQAVLDNEVLALLPFQGAKFVELTKYGLGGGYQFRPWAKKPFVIDLWAGTGYKKSRHFIPAIFYFKDSAPGSRILYTYPHKVRVSTLFFNARVSAGVLF